jgi:hypothetical protein
MLETPGKRQFDDTASAARQAGATGAAAEAGQEVRDRPMTSDNRARSEEFPGDVAFLGDSRRRGSRGRVFMTGNEGGHTGLIRATPLSESPQSAPSSQIERTQAPER